MIVICKCENCYNQNFTHSLSLYSFFTILRNVGWLRYTIASDGSVGDHKLRHHDSHTPHQFLPLKSPFSSSIFPQFTTHQKPDFFTTHFL